MTSFKTFALGVVTTLGMTIGESNAQNNMIVGMEPLMKNPPKGKLISTLYPEENAPIRTYQLNYRLQAGNIIYDNVYDVTDANKDNNLTVGEITGVSSQKINQRTGEISQISVSANSDTIESSTYQFGTQGVLKTEKNKNQARKIFADIKAMIFEPNIVPAIDAILQKPKKGAMTNIMRFKDNVQSDTPYYRLSYKYTQNDSTVIAHFILDNTNTPDMLEHSEIRQATIEKTSLKTNDGTRVTTNGVNDTIYTENIYGGKAATNYTDTTPGKGRALFDSAVKEFFAVPPKAGTKLIPKI